MAETIANSTLRADIILSGEKDVIRQYTDIYKTTGVDIEQGSQITTTGQSSPDVDLRGSLEVVSGIVRKHANENDIPASFSLGVAIAASKLIKTLRPTGGRVKIQQVLRRSTTVTFALAIGDPIWASPTSSLKVSNVAPVVGTDAASIALLDKMYIGKSASIVAASLTTDKLIGVWF